MIVLAISLCVGLAVVLIVWSVYRIFVEIPREDRSYLDKPPTGFRVLWPLIKLFAFYLSPIISKSYVYTTHRRLVRAGLEYTVNPNQFFASKIVTALVAGLFAYYAMSILGKGTWHYAIGASLLGFYMPELWLKETTDKRNKEIFRALPFYLDIIILCVESGTNLTTGLQHAVQKAPDGPLRNELARVLREIRSGKTRSDSLRDFAERVSVDGVSSVVSGMIQAERTGASLGPVLRAQADQLRMVRFAKAEKMAMEAPVKLLFPLVVFIFPTTFMVISFVLLSQALSDGLITWGPMVWAYHNP